MASHKEKVSPPASTDNLTVALDTASSVDHRATDTKPTRSSFKHLFSFTRWNHAGSLIAALIASAAFAAIKSVYSVILGKIFDVVSDFGAGRRSGSETLDDMAHWGLILLGLGISNWLASTVFLSLWVIFGELQANAVRQDIFASLLSREISWFDALDQGISSLLVRIQTKVYSHLIR